MPCHDKSTYTSAGIAQYNGETTDAHTRIFFLGFRHSLTMLMIRYLYVQYCRYVVVGRHSTFRTWAAVCVCGKVPSRRHYTDELGRTTYSTLLT